MAVPGQATGRESRPRQFDPNFNEILAVPYGN
jgi:hypothetical protein